MLAVVALLLAEDITLVVDKKKYPNRPNRREELNPDKPYSLEQLQWSRGEERRVLPARMVPAVITEVSPKRQERPVTFD